MVLLSPYFQIEHYADNVQSQGCSGGGYKQPQPTEPHEHDLAYRNNDFTHFAQSLGFDVPSKRTVEQPYEGATGSGTGR